MDTIIYIVGMLALGVGVGMVSGALGLGGGVIMVPAFLAFVPGMDPHTAKGTSLFIIIFVSAINAWSQTRDWEKIPWRLVFCLAAGAIVGGYASSWLTNILSDEMVLAVFMVILLILAWSTFSLQPTVLEERITDRRLVLSVFIGILAGLAGGATGTGGGSVLVPLVLLAGVVRNKRAVALSNMVMVATAIAGSIANFQAETEFSAPWTYGVVALSLVPLVFIGSQIGSPIGRRLNPLLTLQRRRVVMGVLLLLISLELGWKLMQTLS